MLFKLLIFLLLLHTSITLHPIENAKLYEERLGNVQPIAGYIFVHLHLDLEKLRYESQLLANGSQTLRKMCEQLIEANMYDLCRPILSYDLPNYTTIADEVKLDDNTIKNASATSKLDEFHDLRDLFTINYKRTVTLNGQNSPQLIQIQSTLDMFNNEIYNQNTDFMRTRSNVDVLYGMLQGLAQAVTRKQKVVSLLSKPTSNEFNFNSLHSLMTQSEKKQLLAKIVFHSSKLKNTAKPNETTIRNALQIAHCQLVVSNDHFFVKLSVPLLTNHFYTALKVTILPAMHDDVLAFPQIKDDIIFIDENNHFVASVSYSTYRNMCQSLSDTLICDFQRIEEDKRVWATYNCVYSLVFDRRTFSCQTLVMRNNQNVWLATLNPNSWLYIFPRKESILITVNNGQQSLETFHGTGLLNLAPNMTVQSKHFVVRYTNDPQVDRGKIRTLPFNISYQTMSAVSMLNVSQTQLPTGKVLISEKEKHTLFVSGIDENLLKQLWESKQVSTVEDPNAVLYNVLTVITLMIVLFCLFIVAMCDTSKQHSNTHHNEDIASAIVKYETTTNNIAVDKCSPEETIARSVADK